MPDEVSLGKRLGMPEKGTGTGVEQGGTEAEWGGVGGGARGAPADDVTSQPSFNSPRAGQGAELRAHHGGLPG